MQVLDVAELQQATIRETKQCTVSARALSEQGLELHRNLRATNKSMAVWQR